MIENSGFNAWVCIGRAGFESPPDLLTSKKLTSPQSDDFAGIVNGNREMR